VCPALDAWVACKPVLAVACMLISFARGQSSLVNCVHAMRRDGMAEMAGDSGNSAQVSGNVN
jgi:hypothetical protein